MNVTTNFLHSTGEQGKRIWGPNNATWVRVRFGSNEPGTLVRPSEIRIGEQICVTNPNTLTQEWVTVLSI